MFVEGGKFARGRILAVAILLVCSQQGGLQEGYLLVQNGVIPGRFDVVGGDKGQPEQIVGDARAHPAPGRRMPPVQHIPRLKLVVRRAQNMLARQPRRGMNQGHHILQLIAKAKGTAGLIEARTPPDAAGQTLVEQPAVQQQIHGRVWGVNLHRAQQHIPLAVDCLPGFFHLGRVLEAGSQGHRFGPVFALAQQKPDLFAASRRQIDV